MRISLDMKGRANNSRIRELTCEPLTVDLENVHCCHNMFPKKGPQTVQSLATGEFLKTLSPADRENRLVYNNKSIYT